ncbi:MAG: efflux RND transporter permease subunit, partial [Candidatus Electrothrix sp. AUS3]|nr:efflux RND transporter permease subunit [Candidatus Electrothrix gigas]
LTLIVTLSSSLFVALIINPALASLFMKSAKQVKTVSSAEVEAAGEQPVTIQGPLLRSYAGLLRFSLAHPFALIAAAVFLLIFMVQGWLLVVGIEKPREFFPDIDPKGIYVNTDMPEGADLNYIDNILGQIEAAMAGTGQKASHEGKEGPSDLENVNIIYSKAVTSTGGGSEFEANTPNHVGVRFIDLEDRSRSTHETVEDIRKRLTDIAGAKVTVAMEAAGPPTGAAINIEISGDNFNVLGAIAKEIRATLEKIPHVEDIRDNFVEGTPSVRIRIDRQKAALFGLNTSSIGSAIKTSYNGMIISSFREGNEDYDITVQLPEEYRKMDNVLREFMIPTPTGVVVPLSTLATVDYTGSLGNINRINNRRTITVKANVDETKIPGPVVRKQAEKLLA